MSGAQGLTPIAQQAREFIENGFVLTPIPFGSKGPRTPGWNRRENAWTKPEHIPANYLGNLGLLHEFSRTGAVDIDNLVLAIAIFKSHGIHLPALIEAPDAVLILSGRENRLKLLYRMPANTSLRTHVYSHDGEVIYELRADGVQDVLPRSLHPDTGKPYEWGGQGDWRKLPTLPEELLRLWNSSKQVAFLPPANHFRPTLSTVGTAGLKPEETPENVAKLHLAVSKIPPCATYIDWRNVIWSIRAHGFAEGKAIARGWSDRCADEYPDAATAFDSIWNNDKGFGVGAGTVYFLADKYSKLQRESAQEIATAITTPILATNKARGSPVVVVDISKLLSSSFPQRMLLLSPWLESQSLVMIYAWRGIGKTHVALAIAHALASGGEFLGWHATVPTPVLYIDGEMPGPALKERVARIVESNVGGVQPGYLSFITPDLQPNGVMPNLATYDGQQAIEAALGNAKVIIVDNLSCLARSGKENEAESWQPVADWALRMRASGRCVIFIHHSGKGGAQRGTSKREDLLDAVLLLKRPGDYTPSQGARFEIHFEKARALFGQDVAPIEAKLETAADGKQTWTTKTVDSIADGQMIELAKLGLSQAEIARELGCNRSTVLRALAKAEAEGRYKPKSKPTKSPKTAKREGGAQPTQ